MQILNRAKNTEMDIIPLGESKKNVKEEANRRTWKAGYTDRDGQPKRSRSNGSGKGDIPRHVNKELYDINYARIFGHS